ncbi:MAG: PQQ-binding-like beta-propeller repeat protein [Polyangiaceae bacterium]
MIATIRSKLRSGALSGTWKSGPLGAFAVTAALAGCASTTANDRVNPEVPLWFNRPSGSMHVYIDRELTAPTRQVGEDYEHGRPGIDPIHGRIFVGSSDRGLYALRAGDGATLWRFETLGVVQCEPLYDPQYDIVYFGSHDGALYAVQGRNGVLLWRFSSGAEVSRRPVIGGPGRSILYFANGADQLFAIERATGKQVWTVHRTPALGMEIAAHAGPAFDGEAIYMAYSDGHVAAYDAKDGSERWPPVDLSAEAEQSLGDAPRYLDVDSTPVVEDLPGGKVVYVASYAGGVFALDAKSGSRVWVNDKAVGATELLLWQEPAHASREAAPGSQPGAGLPWVPAKRILIASSGVSGLWGLDPTTGHKLWRVPVPEGGITAAAPIAGALLVGTTQYGLFLMSPLDGRPIDGLDLGTGFAETPATYGNRGFIMSNAGTFLGIVVDDPLGRRGR